LAAELTGFDREIVDADLLITGEGRTDRQTVMGKLPMVLARRARAKGVWTILLSGAIADGVSEDLGSHFDEMHATVDDAVDPAEAIRGGRERLAAAAAALARKLSTTS
jgi:glycerate kinase